MKRVLALVLVVVLVMGLAVSAAANGILNGSVGHSLPALTQNSENVKLHSLEDVQKLSEEIQNLMAEAQEELKNVDSKGLGLKYFFYTEILSGESSVSVEFEPIPHGEILFMQYINGMWVTLEHSVAENGCITTADVVAGPFAIFTEPVASPGASQRKLVPILTDEAALAAQIHTSEEVAVLSEEIQNRMADAKAKLKDACPEGFAVKYFFEMEKLGTESPISVTLEPIDHSEIAFKQYVDGAWVDLEYAIDSNGIITLAGVVDGPVAVFTK